MTRYTVHFSGRVQGVGFRATAVEASRGRAVSGYVQNLPDGRVRLVAEGEEAELDAFLEAVKQRMGRLIERTQLDRGEATGELGRPEENRFGMRA